MVTAGSGFASTLRAVAALTAAIAAGSAGAAVVRLQAVSGAGAGQAEPMQQFVELMNIAAGAGVVYGKVQQVPGGDWVLTQRYGDGATPSVFDGVVQHAMGALRRDVTVQVGYGPQAPAVFTGVLIDAFVPDASGLGTGTQLFDLEDLLKMPVLSPDVLLQQALLLHGFYELASSVFAPSGYAPAHQAALGHENNVSHLRGGPQRTNAVNLVAPPAGAPAGYWGLAVPVTTFGGKAGFVVFEGQGDGGNLQRVRQGPLDTDGAGIGDLPSRDGDIHLDRVRFVEVAEPSVPALVVAALLAAMLATGRRPRSATRSPAVAN